MSARSIENRLVKLESHRRNPNQIMVVWRIPGMDVRMAIDAGNFGNGDKVICAEWFGEGPPPAPHPYFGPRGMRIDEDLEPHMTKSIERIVHMHDGDRLSKGFNLFPRGISQDQMQRMTDGELAYALLGVRP